MATTSLWHIQGHLRDLMAYVENPEKTCPIVELQDLWDAARYVQRPAATADGHYVTAINCLRETAVEQMILTKKQYGKIDGYIAFHGYQSFKPGEVTPQECHDIGVELAKEMWGDRFQIIVTTHLDKEHLHSHFCFNSVSFRDGKKYNYSKAERVRMMEISDRLCIEHGLSIIKHPHKAPSRTVYFDEKSGKPTRYNVYREDVYDAIDGNRNPRMIEKYLNDLGYITDFTGVHWKIRLPQYSHFTRLDTLDERLTPEWIRQNCGCRAQWGNTPGIITEPPRIPSELERVWQYGRRTGHIFRLYLYWQYQLGILPRGTSYKPTSPFLREELRKLDHFDEEVRYLAANQIETIDELNADMKQTKAEMDKLIDERTHLTYQMRHAAPDRKRELHEEKERLTKRITALRHRLKLAEDIDRRSRNIDEVLERVEDSRERAYEAHHRTERERREYER